MPNSFQGLSNQRKHAVGPLLAAAAQQWRNADFTINQQANPSDHDVWQYVSLTGVVTVMYWSGEPDLEQRRRSRKLLRDYMVIQEATQARRDAAEQKTQEELEQRGKEYTSDGKKARAETLRRKREREVRVRMAGEPDRSDVQRRRVIIEEVDGEVLADLTCQICNISFADYHALGGHVQICGATSACCQYCRGLSQHSSLSINQHERNCKSTIEERGAAGKCAVCRDQGHLLPSEFLFDTTEDMLKHYSTHHAQEAYGSRVLTKMYECSDCRRSMSGDKLILHSALCRKTVDPEDLLCSICALLPPSRKKRYNFKSQVSLNRHSRQSHKTVSSSEEDSEEEDSEEEDSEEEDSEEEEEVEK